MTDLSCPVCGSEFDLATAFASESDQEALIRLASVSVPLGSRVLQYIALHAPTKQRLTAAKKIKLILQLLPDLERQAITYKGRDIEVPLAVWASAFDQLLVQRDDGRLELPLRAHSYLYAALTGIADKRAAQQEQKSEEQKRLNAQRDTVQVRGQTMSIGEGLQVMYGGKDPALAALDERNRKATGIPPEIRARMNQIKKGA